MLRTLGLCVILCTASASAQPLSLQDAVRSVASQPRLNAAGARIERARAAQKESEAVWGPRLGLDASYTYTTPNASLQQGGQTLVFSQSQNYLATLRLTTLLFNGGFYANLSEARRWQTAVAQERARETQLDLQQEAALAFLDTLAAEQTLRLAEQQLEQERARTRQSEKLFQAGTVARFDVLSSRAEEARAESEIVETRRLLQLRRSALSSLVGRPVDVLVEPAPAEVAEVSPNRPDLRVAQLALEEAAARLRAAEAENSPSLSLQSDVQQRNATVAFPGTQWNTGLVFTWPFADGGAAAARVEAGQAELRELQAQAEEVQRLALLDIEQRKTEEQARLAALQSALVQETSAAEAWRVAELRYENGLSTYIERQQAQLMHLRAQRQLLQARYDLWAAQARRRRSLGYGPVEDDK